MGSFLPSQISALIFAPVGFLYLWMGAYTEFDNCIFIGAACLTFCAVMILRSPDHNDSEGQWGFITVAGACVFLAAMPALAATGTPGLCTDGTNFYEGSLLAFMHLTAILVGHSVSKAAFKKKVPVRKGTDHIFKFGPAVMSGCIAIAFLMYRNGLCMPGMTYVIPFLVTIPAFGILSFLISAKRRGYR